MRKILVVLGVGLLLLSGCGSKHIAPAHRNQSDFEYRYSKFELGDLAGKAEPGRINVAIANCIPAIGGLYVDLVVFAPHGELSLSNGELQNVALSLSGSLEHDPNRWLVVHDESGKKVKLDQPVTSSSTLILPIPPSRPEYEMWGPSFIASNGQHDIIIQTVRGKAWATAGVLTCSFAENIWNDPPSKRGYLFNFVE